MHYTFALTQEQHDQLINALRTHPDPDVELLAKFLIESKHEYRFIIEEDYYPDLTYLDLTEKQFEEASPIYTISCNCPTLGEHSADCEPLTWEEYCESVGDYQNWVSFIVTQERNCAACGGWESIDAIGGLDFYLPGKERVPEPGLWTLEDLKKMSWGGYVLECMEVK